MAKPQAFNSRLMEEAARLAASVGFTPVLLRRRVDGWTPERQLAYLAILAAGGSSREAADRVGMTVQSAGRLMRRAGGQSFARACEAAWLIGEPRRRAVAAARRTRRLSPPSAPEVFPSQGSRNY